MVEDMVKDPLLVVLLGPTASGKTALSLSLAERLGGEIVNCDSVAVYREMEIGTAKPSCEERARVPHHLLDIVTPAEPYTAGDYSRGARSAIRDITARGKLPVVTGGTGLYLRALLEGLFAGPQRDEELRERLRRSAERRSSGWLHRILQRLDAPSAARIHANDEPKLIRAIEVCLAARRPMSDALMEGRDPFTGYRILRIGLNPERQQRYERIDSRAAAMFSRGLVEETAALVARYGKSCRIFDSLGYRQAKMILAGEMSREEAITAAQQGHRNYAKRQLTWFRREPDVQWINDFGDKAETIECAVRMVTESLLNATET
jgi:tRNA dimethylallyltransferase